MGSVDGTMRFRDLQSKNGEENGSENASSILFRNLTISPAAFNPHSSINRCPDCWNALSASVLHIVLISILVSVNMNTCVTFSFHLNFFLLSPLFLLLCFHTDN